MTFEKMCVGFQEGFFHETFFCLNCKSKKTLTEIFWLFLISHASFLLLVRTPPSQKKTFRVSSIDSRKSLFVRKADLVELSEKSEDENF